MNVPTFISVLRNAIKANKHKILIKPSKKILNFLNVLIEYKYISTYFLDIQGNLHIFLTYTRKKNRILSLKYISKPSRPIYFSHKDLWKFNQYLGLLILNTPKGIISHQIALKNGLGGEALCFVF